MLGLHLVLETLQKRLPLGLSEQIEMITPDTIFSVIRGEWAGEAREITSHPPI
jgi:hypothetical protein